MPRSRRKRAAGTPNCEVSEIVAPGGVEFLSVDIFAGKVIKKRAVEQVHFEIQPAADDTPLFDANADDAENGTPTTNNPKGPSRSASVGAFLVSAYNISLKPAGEDTRMASSPRNRPGRSSPLGWSHSKFGEKVL